VPEFEFHPNELHRLGRLMLALRSARLDVSSGGHRAAIAGEGIDFLDFRPYTPGDDFRRIDWNLFGRLGQLFVRLNETSRQLAVSLLIDSSQSMLFGIPVTKLQQAQLVACGLGFMALKNGDRVNVVTFADGIIGRAGPMSGVRSLPSLVKFLQKSPAGGPSDLLTACKQLRSRRQHRGLVVIISDFLNVSKCQEALSTILAGGGKVLVIQILDNLDRGIGLKGSVRLRDSESGQLVDVHINDEMRSAFQLRFETHRRQLEDYCLHHQQNYVQALTSDNYLELISSVMRAKAVVQ
jgi:uncharacterized protein (DUF58 family)